METKHTKGPWEIGNIYLNKHGVKTVSIDAPNVNVVSLCEVYADEEVDMEDAKLIAAAPELLEVLMEAKETLEYLRNVYPVETTVTPTIQKIENAIKKATE